MGDLTCEGVPVVIDEAAPFGFARFEVIPRRQFAERFIVIHWGERLVVSSETYGWACAVHLAEAFAPDGFHG